MNGGSARRVRQLLLGILIAGIFLVAPHVALTSTVQRPMITQYPKSIERDTVFSVAGLAGSTVRVRVNVLPSSTVWGRILYSNEIIAAVETMTDDAGYWNAMLAGLPRGVYRIEAHAIDDRGVASDASDPVRMYVGYEQFGWRAIALLVLAMIACLIWWSWHTALRQSDEKKIPSKLHKLIADMDEEIALLGRVAKHRSLYPEESYLRSKLIQYRKTLRAFEPNTHRRLAKRK